MITKETAYPSSLAVIEQLKSESVRVGEVEGSSLLRDAAELLDAAIGDAVAWRNRS